MSSLVCPENDELVDERISRILTQYRESPKLIFLLRTYLKAVQDMHLQVCDLPSMFRIDDAIGDQLTILGKRLGWPRCHCVCDVQPVAGFDCEGVVNDYPIDGFCDEGVTWVDCGNLGFGEICINDDELYRKFLKVRRYQMTSIFDIASLEECVRIFWGAQARVISSKDRRVVVGPGRELSNVELSVLQLYPRVLPVALGIEVRFHFSETKTAGFGEGWGGFCEPVVDFANIITEDGFELVDENGNEIVTNPITKPAPWTCEIDVRPYDC